MHECYTNICNTRLNLQRQLSSMVPLEPKNQHKSSPMQGHIISIKPKTSKHKLNIIIKIISFIINIYQTSSNSRQSQDHSQTIKLNYPIYTFKTSWDITIKLSYVLAFQHFKPCINQSHRTQVTHETTRLIQKPLAYYGPSYWLLWPIIDRRPTLPLHTHAHIQSRYW